MRARISKTNNVCNRCLDIVKTNAIEWKFILWKTSQIHGKHVLHVLKRSLKYLKWMPISTRCLTFGVQ